MRITLKVLKKAELTLAQYIEITSQLTYSGVPDWTKKQVTLWARPDSSIQDIDIVK